MVAACGPSVLDSLASHLHSGGHEYNNVKSNLPSSTNSSSSKSYKNPSTFRELTALDAQLPDDEYSADFSPEAFTKRLVYRAGGGITTEKPKFPATSVEDPYLYSDSPLLPPTPCVPAMPLDTNKGYPLPTNAFTDADWIAEYSRGNLDSAVLIPPEISIAEREATERARGVPNSNAPLHWTPSVTNSLVQTDIDGDDSMYWYKSTTRFASRSDQIDYERLRKRIREYTLKASSFSSASSSCGRMYATNEFNDMEGLGPAADVTETVRQTTVRRLKALLAHLTGIGSADTAAAEISSEDQDISDGIAEVNGEDIDIAKLRRAIEELSIPRS
ncbi:uncharacterized protein V1516DRAFT_624640 [Lipomyces oligophaga]|uniref:uncharacterized protein n=1 Tax=Lipomyces oligophaga TaxID=45792 RepID=UPI0034CF7AEF